MDFKQSTKQTVFDFSSNGIYFNDIMSSMETQTMNSTHIVNTESSNIDELYEDAMQILVELEDSSSIPTVDSSFHSFTHIFKTMDTENMTESQPELLQSHLPNIQNTEDEKRRKRQEAVRRCRRRKKEEIAQLKKDSIRLAKENKILNEKIKIYEAATKERNGSNLDENLKVVYSLRNQRISILRTLWDSINVGGLEELVDAFDTLYEEGYTLSNPGFSTPLNIAEAKEFWNEIFAAFPDGLIRIKSIDPGKYNEDITISKLVLSGTHVAPIFGIAPRKKKIEVLTSVTTHWKGTKILYEQWCWNACAFTLELLGVNYVT